MSENSQNTTAAEQTILPDPSKLVVSSSPHIHSGENISRIMFLVIVSLLPACAAGIYFFGLNALKVILLCTFFCVAIEEICCRIARKPSTIKDGSAALTGVLLAMNLSAGVPWWICLIGAILAIGLAKQLYGGLGYNPFNPALVARVGLLIGFTGIMTTWEPTTEMLKKSNHPLHSYIQKVDSVTCPTPLGIVKEEKNKEKLKIVTGSKACAEYAIGNVGGCLGETSALALLVGGLALIVLKIIRWQVPLGFIGTVAVFTGIVHHFSPDTTPSAVFHLVTGGLFLGAFFMATDMVTSPMTGLGALIFGIGCGLITSVIRIWGSYPEGVSFSILIMNALTPFIDKYTANIPFGYRKPKPAEKKA